MNKTISSRLKNFRLKKLLSVVLLVGVLLFSSTACGRLTQAKTSADVREDVFQSSQGQTC